MANYLTTDTELQSIADAIRTKGGTSAPLVYPSGFVSAIENIESGGGADPTDFIENHDTWTSYENSSAMKIAIGTFYYCSNLTSVSFPACTSIGSNAFYYCVSLTSVSFPACTSIGSSAFYYCSNLTSVSFPACTSIGNNAFYRCANLISIYLTGSSFVTLANSNALSSTPIAGYTTSTGGVYGSIYVPASMLASYKTRTNWTYYSDRMVGV